jgi:hypothetical protein
MELALETGPVVVVVALAQLDRMDQAQGLPVPADSARATE